MIHRHINYITEQSMAWKDPYWVFSWTTELLGEPVDIEIEAEFDPCIVDRPSGPTDEGRWIIAAWYLLDQNGCRGGEMPLFFRPHLMQIITEIVKHLSKESE